MGRQKRKDGEEEGKIGDGMDRKGRRVWKEKRKERKYTFNFQTVIVPMLRTIKCKTPNAANDI